MSDATTEAPAKKPGFDPKKVDQNEAHRKELEDTLHMIHNGAYKAAADELLYDEKKHIYVFSKLLKSDVREKFADRLIGHYKKAAMERFGIKELGKDKEIEEDLLLQAYIGTTKDQIRRTVEQHKNMLTPKAWEDYKSDLVKSVNDSMRRIVYSDITYDTISPALKYMKMDSYIDETKITPDEVKFLMQSYHANNNTPLGPNQINDERLLKKDKKAAPAK